MTDTTSNKLLEIEISYLPDQLPQKLLTGNPTRIVDVYLSDESDLLHKLRLRQKGNSYEITKKVNIDPHDFSKQEEYNIPLTEQEFKKLQGVSGRQVVKDRYEVVLGKHTLEIDVFKEALDGLVIIEVEFNSLDDRDAFKPPEYFGIDVTQEDFIAGAYLAGKTYADIKPKIGRLRHIRP